VSDDETIRHALRRSTAGAHADIDEGMAALDLAVPSEYATFLAIQLRARAPIEQWMAASCPFEWQAPSQTALIQADLAALGASPDTTPLPRFSAAPEGALGVAWALGGSSLGNRAMLSGLRKRGVELPVKFLCDEAMPAFFVRLRRTLERPAGGYPDLSASIGAAHAVFAMFALARSGIALKRAA
jgi:heme oxygenase